MINRIKNLFELEAKLAGIEDRLEKAAQSLEQASGTIGAAAKDTTVHNATFAPAISALSEHHKTMAVELAEISEVRKKLVTELRELKLVKGRIHEEIKAEVAAEVQHELAQFRQELAKCLEPLKELSATTAPIRDEILKTRMDLKRFEEIAKGLKEKDFTLERHAAQLAAADQEKLHLMRRIDILERMVAQQRRYSHDQGKGPDHRVRP
ncbi:MAG: hypothetical protein V1735_05555 [Nanoarchaeota archaeon]